MGKKKKKQSSEEALREVAAQARQAGMSYGKFTALQYLKEQTKMKQRIDAAKQAEIIAKACREYELDGSITWFTKNLKPRTHAEKIAAECFDKKEFPAKTSFLFCDELDMCFFFSANGTARVAFSGTSPAGSADITKNFIMAFRTAEKVLERMQELADIEKRGTSIRKNRTST